MRRSSYGEFTPVRKPEGVTPRRERDFLPEIVGNAKPLQRLQAFVSYSVPAGFFPREIGLIQEQNSLIRLTQYRGGAGTRWARTNNNCIPICHSVRIVA